MNVAIHLFYSWHNIAICIEFSVWKVVNKFYRANVINFTCDSILVFTDDLSVLVLMPI